MRFPLHALLPLLAALGAPGGGARGEIIGMDTFDLSDGPAHGKVSGAFWDFDRHRGHRGASAPWCGLSGDPEFRGGRLATPAPCKALRTFAHANLDGRGPGYGHNKPGQVYEGIVDCRGSVIVRAQVETTAAETGVGVHFYDWNTERVYLGTLRAPDAPRQWGVELGKSDGNGPKPEEMGAFPSGLTLVPGKACQVVCQIDWSAKAIHLWLDPAPGPRPAPTFSRPYSARNWITAVAFSSFGEGTAHWDEIAVATRWEVLP